MSYHVDIIGIDPLVGTQTLLGRVFADTDSGLQIEGDEQLHATVAQIASSIGIEPDSAPVEFLDALARRIDYTYMIASAPHEVGECAIGVLGETVRGQLDHRSVQPA